MGLFDRWKSGRGGAGEKQETKAKGKGGGGAASKWAGTAGDKRAQNYDRLEAIQALAELGTGDAATALLRRFTFNIDPSITDQEEKETAYAGVLKAGMDALDPVRAFSAKAESVAWPLRILKALLDEPAYVDEVLALLGKWDTEYAKFIDPKLQLLTDLEEHQHPHVRAVVEPFLEDVNEPARFHAVGATLAQDDDAAVQPLLRALAQEESVRVRHRVADGFASRGWLVPADLRDDTRKSLPSAFSLDAQGRITKR